jgi:hypothetical protein
MAICKNHRYQAEDIAYVSEYCLQCDNKGLIDGIGGREVPCEAMCTILYCGKPIHECGHCETTREDVNA